MRDAVFTCTNITLNGCNFSKIYDKYFMSSNRVAKEAVMTSNDAGGDSTRVNADADLQLVVHGHVWHLKVPHRLKNIHIFLVFFSKI